MTDPKIFPPLTELVDDGMQRAIQEEIDAYNQRRGDRYPLSPSVIGRCSLRLARDLAHYHGISDYPRAGRESRLQRIFDRGDLLELAMVSDFEKRAGIKMQLRQQRVRLFKVSHDNYHLGVPPEVPIEGNIDGVAVCGDGTRILVDFKSKGSFYSAGFGDSVSEFFGSLPQTGLAEDLGNKCYYITDVHALWKLMSQDDFFAGYLLQLNAYALSDWFREDPVDFVSLYYENKNTCENFEVRWVPDPRLFTYAKEKFQRIFETVMTEGPESVPRDFVHGSGNCKLCEYNKKCNGENLDFHLNRQESVGSIPEAENDYLIFKEGVNHEDLTHRAEERIILAMEQKGLTHIVTNDGLKYEKKFLKSPKPHFELRLCK